MHEPVTQPEAHSLIDLAQEAAFGLGASNVHPRSCEVILGGGDVVHLQPRVMQVLICLAKGLGQPVSRDLLAVRCWGGVAVNEDAINRCIQRLRRLSQVEAADSFAIETIPRVGYRLRARLREGRGCLGLQSAFGARFHP